MSAAERRKEARERRKKAMEKEIPLSGSSDTDVEALSLSTSAASLSDGVGAEESLQLSPRESCSPRLAFQIPLHTSPDRPASPRSAAPPQSGGRPVSPRGVPPPVSPRGDRPLLSPRAHALVGGSRARSASGSPRLELNLSEKESIAIKRDPSEDGGSPLKGSNDETTSKGKRKKSRAKSKSPRGADREADSTTRAAQRTAILGHYQSESNVTFSSEEEDSPGPVRSKDSRRMVRSMLSPVEAEQVNKSGNITLRSDFKRRSVRKKIMHMDKQQPPTTSVEQKIDKRKMLVEEIMSTEKTFVAALEELTGGMLTTLVGISHEFGSASELPEKELHVLFSTGGIILQYSKLLLEMLEPRVMSWSVTTCIGDIFLQLGDFMKIYTQYVKEYEPFVNKFQAARLKNRILRERLAELTRSGSTAFLSFESKLIVPVQRIPRYQLLLRDLVKYTPEDHPDRQQLDQALEKIEEVGSYVNERQRHYEGLNKVLELQERFGKQLTDNTGIKEFVRSHRRVMKEGRLKFVRTKAKILEAGVYLMNDVVLVGGHKSLGGTGTTRLLFLGCLWEYELLDIAPEEGEEDSFELGLVSKDGGDLRCVLRAADESQKTEWLFAFDEVMDNLSRAIVLGSEMERERKISITHNETKWNQGSIPPEIARALAEEQAMKRKNATVVSINASSEDATSPPASSGPASWSQGAMPEGIAAALAEQTREMNRASTIGVGPAAAGGGVNRELPDSVAALLAKQETPSRLKRGSRILLRSSKTTSELPPSGLERAQKARSEPTSRRRRASTLNQTLRKVVREPTSSAMDALLTPRVKAEPKPEKKPLGTMYARVLEVRKLKFKSSKETISAFVKFKLDGNDHTTPVCPAAVHPVWKENNSFTAELFQTDNGHLMEVELHNKLPVGEAFHSYININITTDKTNSRLVDKWFTLKNKKNKVVGEIRLQLRYVSAEDYGSVNRESIQDVFDDSVETDLSLSEQRLVEYLADLGGSSLLGK